MNKIERTRKSSSDFDIFGIVIKNYSFQEMPETVISAMTINRLKIHIIVSFG